MSKNKNAEVILYYNSGKSIQKISRLSSLCEYDVVSIVKEYLEDLNRINSKNKNIQKGIIKHVIVE